MKLYKKKKFLTDGIQTKRYYVFGVKCLEKKYLGNHYLYSKLFSLKLNYKLKTKFNYTNQEVILWIDHNLGGGTEVYSKNQFKDLKHDFLICRMQYIYLAKKYLLSMNHSMCVCQTLDEIWNILQDFHIKQIVVNNLVGYESSTKILSFVKDIKAKLTSQPLVSFRGHDFQCICPSFNLANCDGYFCNGNYKSGCETCWKHKILDKDPISNKILMSGATTIKSWRREWNNFFNEVCDEVIVFSECIRNIFLRIYPCLGSKIKVVPHKVKKYPIVKVKKHDGINIAFLGNMLKQKGSDIVREMYKYTKTMTGVKLVIIGNFDDAPDGLLVHGSYKQKNLPQLMRKYNVDIVFISSIWPETFSYTTSEAMSMGIPVACYNMGAPAERVSKYGKGLVLNEINPQKNLNQIIEFVEKRG